jgi:hypothetical protein
LAECLAHVALAAVTALAWLGLGSLLLAPLGSGGDRLLNALNRIGVGAIAFALLTFAAGWSGLLYAEAYLPVLAATAATGVVALGRLLSGAPLPRPREWTWWQRALAALLAVYVLLDIVATCAPISSPDALLYHAADPALFEKDHRVFEIPWNSSSYEPFTVEMLVLDGFLLWDSVQGAFAPLLLALVALAAVAGVAERLAGRSAALLAAAILFAQPFMTWEATSIFVEAGLAAAVALAGWNLVRFIRHDERNALVLAGVFAGGAAGMKYLGLFVAVAVGLVGVMLTLRRLRPAHVAAFVAPAAVVALPWYAKNLVLTGNPIYPHVFGGLNPYAEAELEDTRRMFGHGHSLLDLVLLPARLLADAKPFDGGEFLSPLFLIFAPLVFLQPRARRPSVAIWMGVVLYVVAWFYATQQARFLVPLMPVLAVLAALGVLALADAGRLGRIATAAVTAAALVAGLTASSVYAAQFVPVVAGAESREEFLGEKVSHYPAIEWLNRHLGPEDKLLIDSFTLLYLDVPYITFGTMGDLLPPTAGREETREFVRENGVTHIAVLAEDKERRQQVRYLDTRLVARIPVRWVRSRTLKELGPPETMLIYAVARSA